MNRMGKISEKRLISTAYINYGHFSFTYWTRVPASMHFLPPFTISLTVRKHRDLVWAENFHNLQSRVEIFWEKGFIVTRCEWCWKSQVPIAISRQPFNCQKWTKRKEWKTGSMLHTSKAAARTANSKSMEVRISAYKQGKHMGFLGFPGLLTITKWELWPSAGHMVTHMRLPGRTHNPGK